jgi:hypothetical protein
MPLHLPRRPTARSTPRLLPATVLCALLGASAAPTTQAANAAAPAASAASAPAEGARAELAPAFNAVQDLLRAQKFAEARAWLADLKAAPNPSAYETYQITRMELSVAVGLNEGAAAERLYGLVVASGRLMAEELLPLRYNVMVAAYRSNDYARAAGLAATLRGNAGMTPTMNEQAQQIQVQSLYLSKDYAAAAVELEAEFAAVRTAGKVVDEQRLRMLASAYNLIKARDRYLKVVEQLAVAYPKRDYWLDLINAVGSDAKFADRWWLDLLRLKQVVAGLEDAEDYLSAAEAAQAANLFVEARKLLDAGYAAGLLGKGPQALAQSQTREQIAKSVADDDVVINNPAAAAKISREPVALVHWGMSYLAAGQTDTGLALLEEALAQPALKRPDDVRLRLGAAYAVAGQADKARALLARVRGEDGAADLARLWLLHLQRPTR